MDTTPSLDDDTLFPNLTTLVLLGINAALAVSTHMDMDDDLISTPPSRN